MFIKDFISKVVGDKRDWRQYKARRRRLPENYRIAMEAIERYLMYAGMVDDPSSLLGDLIELFEQSAAREAPVREVIGDDPVGFVEDFLRNYGHGQWRIREEKRLVREIERAAGEDLQEERAP